MLGMSEAVARLLHAIDNQEPILIYGDYDVDGTTGTAVLLRALNMLGARTGFTCRTASLKATAFARTHLRKLRPMDTSGRQC
jgi:single-stranded-DNA-specific exonuclease